MLEGVEISWRSKKQSSITPLTYAAEYAAASLACKIAICIFRLHAGALALKDSKCIELRNDYPGAIETSKNAVISKKNKHIYLK